MQSKNKNQLVKVLSGSLKSKGILVLKEGMSLPVSVSGLKLKDSNV